MTTTLSYLNQLLKSYYFWRKLTFMIQRIQSIFLLLSALAFGGLFAVPLASSAKIQESGYFSDGLLTILDTPIFYGIISLAILLSLLAIFLFKNRNLQRSISIFSGVVGIIFIIVATGLLYTQGTFETVNLQVGLGVGLVVIGIVFDFIAARFIKKDEKLVKSMDRLR